MSDSMSIAEAAKRLSISEEEVEARLASGRLRGVEVDRERRVDTASVVQEMTRALSDSLKRLEHASAAAPSAKGGGWVATMVIQLALMLWALALAVLAFSLAGTEGIMHPALFMGGSVIFLVLLGLWERATEEIGTTNGFGVSLYGRRSVSGPAPATKVGTTWLVALMVPLVPLRSHFIHAEEEGEASPFGRSTRYRLSPFRGLCWPQVLPVLLVVWGGLAGILSWLSLG